MDELGHVTRVFLGSDRPALPLAADWLLREFGGGRLDLGDVLVVVPGGRAQRRLMELLAERSVGGALVPPRVVTMGALADGLLPVQRGPIAGRLVSLLAWSRVLHDAEAALFTAVMPHSPGREDWPGWWSLGEQVMQAADELGAHGIMLDEVAKRSTHPGDMARWEALGELARRYEAQLAGQGLMDKHRARIEAAQAGTCGFDGKIVLLGVADLQPIYEQMLSRVDAEVYALVVADASDAAGFDALGGLVPSYWAAREIAIDGDAIVVCDRPNDQAAAVLDAVRGWAEERATAADEVTMGLGDAALAGPMMRTLSLAGLPVRSAAGRPMATARPVMLLRALAAFANGRQFDTLAALLRHPDAQAAIALATGQPTRPWLELLDRYATDHLAARPTVGWLGKDAQAMEAVYQAASSLLPEPIGARRALSQWAEPIGQALQLTYGTRTLNRYAEEDRPLVVALQEIGKTLQSLATLGQDNAPLCTFAQAVTLVVNQVSGQSIPEPGGASAIELVGYLELLLDDAPRMVIAGMNEQHVPEPPRTCSLLPEGVRQSLGLADDARRLARDGYALASMLAFREGMKLIVGKRSQAGDPLLPSRLLLQTDDDTLVQRVSDFVAEQGETAVEAPMLLTPGKQDRFLIPKPVLPMVPITSLRVTAFRDYLACPYRFYLKHVLKLDVLDDRAMEVSAGGFGTLAHQALRILAGEDMRSVSKVETIQDRLSSSLDAVFARTYGKNPPVAARIQAEQLRYRLSHFASVHANMVNEGWRIEHEEMTRRAIVQVDGEPFTIRGQIDRIDRHPELGWRLIDYKTSDKAKRPEQVHTKRVDGQVQWVDLQLPLYLDLSAELGVNESAQLGYINLPKKVSETAYNQADWDIDALQSAREQRDFVIRQVRAGVFWPPKEPPSFDDGLRGICADDVADRAALISTSSGGER